MGWNVNCYMRTGCQERIIDSYFDMVAALESYSGQFWVRFLRLYNRSLAKQRLLCEFDLTRSGRLEQFIPRVNKLINEYGKENVIIECQIAIMRFIPSAAQFPNGESVYVQEPVLSKIHCRGQNCSWNPVKGVEELSIIWDLNSSKLYDLRFSSEYWKNNKLNLLNDIRMILTGGNVAEAWAGGANFEGTLESSFMYYRNNFFSASKNNRLNAAESHILNNLEEYSTSPSIDDLSRDEREIWFCCDDLFGSNLMSH